MMTQLIEFASNHAFLAIAFIALLTLTLINEMKLATQRFSSLTPAGVTQTLFLLGSSVPGGTGALRQARGGQQPSIQPM